MNRKGSRSTSQRVTKKIDERSGQPRGLQTEINPVLLSSNLNLITTQYRNENPYLSTINNHTNDKVTQRLRRGLKFHEKGEISSQIEWEREQQRLKALRQQEEEEAEKLRKSTEDAERRVKITRGELPDTDIGEDKYLRQVEDVPLVEWWDKGYFDENLEILPKYHDDYVEQGEESDDENENEGPSIKYVHHPVPITLKESKPIAKVHLTKKEQKKIRRNRRKLEREEKDTKIKMGLEPKPAPKVKLANMMNVYENNQNISDPTQWEQTVIKQVEERKRVHMETNLQRHQEAVVRRKDQSHNQSDDTPLENCCKVFKFTSLANPKIRYKLNINSKQLSLRGLCVRVGDEGPGIIVIVGKEKACNFYEKLVLHRIKWDEHFQDRATDTVVDMKGNHAEKLWQGYLEDKKFPNFFMRVCHDEQEMRQALRQFDAEHFMATLIQ